MVVAFYRRRKTRVRLLMCYRLITQPFDELAAGPQSVAQ